MATKTQGKGTVVGLAEKLIAGTNKHLANTTQVMLAGGSFTPAQVTERLQELVNLRNDVDAAKASTKARLATEKANMPALRTHMDALVTFVKAAFGNAPDVLADFGLHPKARTPLTVEAKTAAAAKRKATRAARHTTGPKKKLSVTGDVTGIVVTPITSGRPVATAPSGPSAPAPSPGATAAATPHTA
jgi:DNA gyrase/topoisomerase IV subunit B